MKYTDIYTLREMVSDRVDNKMSVGLAADLEDILYDLTYIRIGARVAGEILGCVKTGDEEGPFV